MNELFIERMKDLLQEEYADFEKALTQDQEKALFFNINKGDYQSLIEKFNLKPHHLVQDGYYFDSHLKLGKHPYHDCGRYYIQEPSAMIVASLLDLQPGDKVFDLCAAPGGKSCYVASHLKQTGLVVANDINPLRAGILSSNIERLGLTNTIVTNTAPEKIADQLPEYFDKVILDAPCSGEGMFRKLDQAVETWSIDKVKECVAIQKQLVEVAYKALKPGGQLIYSTCTYNREENEEIVSLLLASHPDLELIPIPLQNGMMPGIGYEECCRLYPHHHLGEGQFIALFKKTENPISKKIPLQKATITKAQKQLVNLFYKDHLTIPAPSYLIENKQHIYAISPDFPILNRIKILRQGLYLGECKKGRFEPSYALSHTLKKSDLQRYVCFDEEDEAIRAYLRGETLPGIGKKGYGVIFVGDDPLSFYKESNNTIKNLIPKGLRKPY